MIGKIIGFIVGAVCCFDLVFIISAFKISGQESRREEEEQ